MLFLPHDIRQLRGLVKHIVLDFGGVMIKLFPEKTYQALEQIVGVSMSPDAIAADMEDMLRKFEKGFINKETFLWNLQRIPTRTPHPRSLIDAWNAMLGEWGSDTFEVLSKLRTIYPLYILSNNNEIHLNKIWMDLQRYHGIQDFHKQYFNGTFYSHHLGMRKPEQDIYNHVIKSIGCSPDQILFVEDTWINADAAAHVGMNVVHHATNDRLNYLLELI